jgi:hypothetical protein
MPVTVAQLLADARGAHTTFQAASGHNDGRGNVQMPDDVAAAEAVKAALRARRAADALDPDHKDHAWAHDESVMRVPSASLVEFYVDYSRPGVPL